MLCCCAKMLAKMMTFYRFFKREAVNLVTLTVDSSFETRLQEIDTIDAVILATVALFILYQVSLMREYFYYRGFLNGLTEAIYGRVLRFKFAREFIDKQVTKLFTGTTKEFNEHIDPPELQNKVMPFKGTGIKKLRAHVLGMKQTDTKRQPISQISGSSYGDMNNPEGFEAQICDIAKEFFYTNPMHFDLFPCARQIELEVGHMTMNLFNPTKDTCSLVTTGGTESNLLAVLAYRNWGYATKGISKPELVMSLSAHPSLNKACEYFGVKCVIVPMYDDTLTINLEAMEAAINSNTIAIVASAPCWPHGTVDPVPAMGQIALKYDIGLHVDSCLGGFIIAFHEQYFRDQGREDEILDFDYAVPGVTTLSCDNHKYGISPKGVSTLTFANKYLRKCAFFALHTWPGGLMATATLQGSRTAAPIVGAWLMMRAQGIEGYQKKANAVLTCADRLRAEIRAGKIPELELVGNGQLQVVCFRSIDPQVSVFSLQKFLSKNRKWKVNVLSYPKQCMNFLYTGNNADEAKVGTFIKQLKAGIKEIRKDPDNPAYKSSNAALYGLGISIPPFIMNDSIRHIMSILNDLPTN